jgi:hypothetical protein
VPTPIQANNLSTPARFFSATLHRYVSASINDAGALASTFTSIHKAQRLK